MGCWKCRRQEVAYKSEEVLGAAIGVARLRKDGYGKGPRDEDGKALNTVEDVLDFLEMLGWQLHCEHRRCVGWQPRIPERGKRGLLYGGTDERRGKTMVM